MLSVQHDRLACAGPGIIVTAKAQNAGMDLDGVTAVVTGGAEGIGGGIAQRLAADGMRVVIADLDENAGRATAARIGGSFVRTDAATTAGVRTAIGTACQLPCRRPGRQRGGHRGAILPCGRPSHLGAHP